MKTTKRLCQTILSLVLVISMFFGIGTKNVSADTITLNDLSDNVTKVTGLIDGVKLLYGYEDNNQTKAVINSIEDQINIINSMISSGDTTGIEEKNNYLLSIYEILNNLKDYNTEFGELMEDLITNLLQYNIALEDLYSSNASDVSYQNGAIIDFIDYRISENQNSGATDVVDALNAMKSLINKSVVLSNTYSNINKDYAEYQNIFNAIYSQYLISDLTDGSEILTNEELLNVYNFAKELISEYAVLFPEVGMGDYISKVDSLLSDNSLSNLTVNGLDLDVTELTNTVYVGSGVENLEVIAIANDKRAKVVVTKPDVLAFGSNNVKIVITALDGTTREYNIDVVRLGEFAEQGDPKDTEPKVEQMVSEVTDEKTENTSNISSDSKDKDTDNKSKDKKDSKKYDEELEEEKGLNGFSVLLIVGGIALIGFGIYMLFGDRDKSIPEVKKANIKEEPKVVGPTTDRPVNKSNSNNKKKNKK